MGCFIANAQPSISNVPGSAWGGWQSFVQFGYQPSARLTDDEVMREQNGLVFKGGGADECARGRP